MKTAGMIMITVCSGFLGISLNSYKKKQIAYLNMLLVICSRICIMLAHSLPDTDEIIRSLKEDSSLSAFDFTLQNVQITDRALIRKIREFFDSIGKYDAQTQMHLAENLSSECTMLKEKYQQEYDKHWRLNISFGLLAGMMFSLIII